MYNEDTKLIKDYHYSNGKLNGICIEYTGNGQIIQKHTFKNGIKQGVFVDNSQRIANFSGSYNNDQLEGLYTRYHKQTGIVEFEKNYSNGVQNGLSKTFFHDGKIETQGNYYNGMLKGYYITYYPNGKIETQTFFDDDKKAGLYEEFDKNGETIVSAHYADDKLNGTCEISYPNGKTKQKTNYVNDIKEGSETAYSPSGFWEVNNEYKNGNMVENTFAKVNTSDIELKDFCQKTFYSFGVAIATDFKPLVESEQVKIDYRIARDFDEDTITTIVFKITALDKKYAAMLTCSQYTLVDIEGKAIIRFQGPELLSQPRQVTIKLSGSDCKNFNRTLHKIVLKPITTGNCENEEGVAHAFGSAFNRKDAIVNFTDSELFKKVLVVIQN